MSGKNRLGVWLDWLDLGNWNFLYLVLGLSLYFGFRYAVAKYFLKTALVLLPFYFTLIFLAGYYSSDIYSFLKYKFFGRSRKNVP